MIVNKQTRMKLYRKWAKEYLKGAYDSMATRICWRCLAWSKIDHNVDEWWILAIKPFPELYRLMQFADDKGLDLDGYWNIHRSGTTAERRELRATILLFCYWIAKDADN